MRNVAETHENVTDKPWNVAEKANSATDAVFIKRSYAHVLDTSLRKYIYIYYIIKKEKLTVYNKL